MKLDIKRISEELNEIKKVYDEKIGKLEKINKTLNNEKQINENSIKELSKKINQYKEQNSKTKINEEKTINEYIKQISTLKQENV